MVSFRPRPRRVQVYFVLFANFAFAVSQNVTVDDAVLVGAVVPQYLPSESVWNIGNNCTPCLAKPDPSLAYNGTWHDTTFTPNTGIAQEIDFTFTGSALYIFFIIANNVPGAITFTDLQFMLDNTVSGSLYVHPSEGTTDYQYNVPVYVNESIDPGTHSVRILPFNTGNQVLMLFDYLVYTTDTSSSVSSTLATTTSTSSPTSSGSQGTSSGDNTTAIIGGIVGAVAALVFAVASLLYCRRYKRRKTDQPSAFEEAMMEPFVDSEEVIPTPFVATVPSAPQPGPTFTEFTLRSKKPGSSSLTLEPSIPPSSVTASSATASSSSGSSAPSSTNPGLVAQFEQLWDEIARLRDIRESPPEYSG